MTLRDAVAACSLIAAVVSTTGWIYTAGENTGYARAFATEQHEIEQLRGAVEGLSRQADQIKSDYARKDVVQEQMRAFDIELQGVRAVKDK